MNFIKLNHNWNSAPNGTDVNIIVSGTDLAVSFELNSLQYTEFSCGDIGTLMFHHCMQYRLGSPNLEGFYSFGESRFKEYGVAWGEFYLVEESDWQETFSDLIAVSHQRPAEMHHYLFYLRDETFECIASDYDFLIQSI